MGYWLTISTSQSTNEANNTSTVTATLTLNSDNWSNYAGGYAAGGSITIGGNTSTFSGPTSYLYPSNPQTGSATLHTHSVTFSHDANGNRGQVGTSGAFNGGGGNAPGALSVSGTTYGALDYVRVPSVPTFNTITRNIDDFSISLNGVTSPAGAPTYYVQRSQDGGSWGDQQVGQSVYYVDLAKGSTQQFRAFASNTDGNSSFAYSTSYSIPNVPSAPSSISATAPSALSSTISIGTSSGNGATITGYFVQASPDDGVTWQTPQQMTNQSYTYTGLTPGATYKFRAYAVNEMGSGAFASTPSTFVPAGGKRWTGSAWQPTQTAKRWTGTQWVDLTIAKRWSGTAWVDLS